MSATLVIECSTPQATVALVEGDVVMQREFTSDRNHNAMLFEPMQELLGGRKDIERVLVGSGPGSYSGTRVGIAAAQGVGLALGCPVIAVPSILAVPAADDGELYAAIGDARRGTYWYCAVLKHQELKLQQLDAKELMQMIGHCADKEFPAITFEPPSQLPFQDFPKSELLKPYVRQEFPDAARLWKAWQANSDEQKRKWAAEVAQPIYIKPPHITPGKRESLINPGS